MRLPSAQPVEQKAFWSLSNRLAVRVLLCHSRLYQYDVKVEIRGLSRSDQTMHYSDQTVVSAMLFPAIGFSGDAAAAAAAYAAAVVVQ